MSELQGLEYVAYAVEASPGWQHLLHEPRHRIFGAGGETHHAIIGQPDAPIVGTVELVAEQGDTLTFIVSEDGPPLTVVLTVLSPTAAEISATSGSDWIRGVAALLSLPDAHGH